MCIYAYVHILYISRNIYSYKYVFFIVGILSICMVGVNFIYIHTAIRYFILVIYIVSLLVVGYKKKNILLKFLIKWTYQKEITDFILVKGE